MEKERELVLLERMEKLEKEVRQLRAREEICNLMGHYEIMHNQKNMRFQPMDFALSMPDVSVQVTDREFNGPEEVKSLFCGLWNIEDYEGIMLIHYLTTPMIEVAEDGKTARGVWWSPGIETVKETPDSDPVAYWCFGSYANDFILENGKWKIWHMRWHRISKCNYKDGWVDAKLNVKLDDPELAKRGLMYNPYHLGYIQESVPMAPLPYTTWDEEEWYLRQEHWEG